MGLEADPSAKATALSISQSPFPIVFWGHPFELLLMAVPGSCERKVDKAEDQTVPVFVGEGTQGEDQAWE